MNRPGALMMPFAVAASALLAIAAAPWALGLSWLAFVFKPLTTVLLIGHALSRGDGPPGMRRWLLAGLVASLAGDVALLWPRQGFVPGLLSFLVAHLCYLVAFTRDAPLLRATPAAFAAYAVVAGALLAVLWPGVPGPLRVPVLAYVVCLAAMAAQAAARAVRLRQPLATRAAVGGALFVCSDALLAFDRFSAPLPAASLLVLATYWAAQWCIASSLPPREAVSAGGASPAPGTGRTRTAS
ncbi:MAG: lysoplasmalogenase [Rhizobacter sp.]